jgi:hypothetical protein
MTPSNMTFAQNKMTRIVLKVQVQGIVVESESRNIKTLVDEGEVNEALSPSLNH